MHSLYGPISLDSRGSCSRALIRFSATIGAPYLANKSSK